MKKSVLFLTILLISLTLTISGCTPDRSLTTTVPPANTGAVAGKVSAAGKIFEFKFSDQYSLLQTRGIMDELLAKIIDEKTHGQVKFTLYHSGSSVKNPDFLSMLNDGAIDIANCQISLYPDQFDFETGAEIPMSGISNQRERLDLNWDLYNRGYFRGLEPYKVLGFESNSPLILFMRRKVATVAEMQGLKIWTNETSMPAFIMNMGGTPVMMAETDLYMNLDQNLIDGVFISSEAFVQMELYKVAWYALRNPVLTGSNIILMNRDKWNNLPLDLQARVEEGIQDFRSVLIDMSTGPDSEWLDEMRARGVEVYAFSAEESAKLKAAAVPIKAEWISSHQARGLPAQEMMDYIDNWVANYKN